MMGTTAQTLGGNRRSCYDLKSRRWAACNEPTDADPNGERTVKDMSEDSTRACALSIQEFYAISNREPFPGTADHIRWMTDLEDAYSRLSPDDLCIIGAMSGPTRGMTLQ